MKPENEMKFSLWTVIGEFNPGFVLCRCDCGIERMVRRYTLLNGASKNCGCIRNNKTGQLNKSHGLSRHSDEYKIWKWMRARCNNPKNQDYDSYGGRGIKICSNWDDFERFLNDMGPRPPKYTIERKDVNGDYSKENCFWATSKQQARNKRNSLRVVHNGNLIPLAEFCEITGINYHTAHHRLTKGYDVLNYNRNLKD